MRAICSGKNSGEKPLSNNAIVALTHVELTWIEGKIEHWIRFGRDVSEKILTRRRRVLSFAPESIFAFVRWASNDYGTVASRIDIVRAVPAGEAYQTLPFVTPGGELLLRQTGWTKVQRVLQAIDAVETLSINAADVSPDYWRHVHNRLAASLAPRIYTPAQHQAWLMRRRGDAETGV